MEHREQRSERTSVWAFAAQVGLFAGIFWGGLKHLEYVLKFTKVHPGFLAKPFFTPTFLHSAAGFWTGWAFFIAFSVLASLLYGATLRRIKGPWMGIGYGIVWWGVLYLLVGPMTGMMRRIDRLDLNSVLSDFCLFAVWGLFIGFSIAFEFTDEREREPSAPHG